MASAAARGGIAPEASRAAPLRLRLRASAASKSPRGAPRRSCCRPARLRAAACASGLSTGRVGVGVAAAEAPTCSAVYKVYCQAGALQYVGLTRNVRATLAAHAAELPPAVCCEAEWEVLGGAGATRGALVAAWKRALAEHLAAGGALPAGNAKGAPRAWAKPSTGASAGARRAVEFRGGADREAAAVAAWRAAPAAERRAAAAAALEADAGDAEAAFALYEAEDELGDEQAALAALRATLAADNGHKAAARLLAAAEGGAAAAAAAAADTEGAAEYARQIFDGYAATFDEHLTETLKYAVPARLVEAADAVYVMAASSEATSESSELPRYACVIDAGCGTGLSGEPLHGRVGTLTGIDVSAKMLDVARAKGLYTELVCDDLVAALKPIDAATCDLLLSADTLMYVGALEAFFEQAARVVRPGGLLAFSVESAERAAGVEAGEEGLALQASGRFAHTRQYIQKLAVPDVWETAAEAVDIVGRMDGEQAVYATLHVLRRR